MLEAEKLMGPRAKQLLKIGAVIIDHGTDVIGKASDGVEVHLGSIFTRRDAATLEDYLAAHPHPEDW